MARRAAFGVRGEYLPHLDDGIRLRAAHLLSGFPGMGTPAVDALERGEAVTLTATAAWSALDAVDPEAARVFLRRHGGPWPWGTAPVFTYDPRTGLLRAVDELEEVAR